MMCSEKLGPLDQYYESVKVSVTGNKRKFSVADVVQDLKQKADWIIRHLRDKEWMTSEEGYSWFNGYYNNDGERGRRPSPWRPDDAHWSGLLLLWAE